MSDIFLLANGPSLNDIDLSKLEDKKVFALNRGYLKLEDDLDHIDYLAVVNPYVENQFMDDFIKLRDSGVKIYSNSIPYTIHYKWTPDIPSFRCSVREPIWQGHTVTYVALQTICSLGYDRVFIVGLDHYFSYKETKKENGLLVTEGNDVDHFDPNYFGKGVKWQPANLERSETAYMLARDAYKRLGKSIYNCSSKTVLSEDVFPRMSYEEVLNEYRN